MYCWNCGKENRQDALYCRYCGEKLTTAFETKDIANGELSVLKNKHRQGTMLIMKPISIHAFQEVSGNVPNVEEQCLCTMAPRSTLTKKQHTNTVMFERYSERYLSSLCIWRRAKRHRTQYNVSNAVIR